MSSNPHALWSRTAKNTDWSKEPLVCLLICSHRPRVCLLCPARFACALRSLVCLLAHFAHSLARGTVSDWMAFFSWFFFIFRTIVPSSHRRNNIFKEFLSNTLLWFNPTLKNQEHLHVFSGKLETQCAWASACACVCAIVHVYVIEHMCMQLCARASLTTLLNYAWVSLWVTGCPLSPFLSASSTAKDLRFKHLSTS